MNGQHFQWVPSFRTGQVIQARIVLRKTAPVFEPSLSAGTLHQDPAHGLGRCGEEVAAMVPVLVLVVPDQPQIGLVNQGSRLKRLAGTFLGQPVRGQSPKLVVDQRQKLPGGVRIAVLDLIQNPRHFIHGG